MSAFDINVDTPIHTPTLGSKFAIKAVEGYRHHNWIKTPTRAILSWRISDFSCASSVMGLPSCSEAALDHLKNYPLWEAIQRQRDTFRTCAEMNGISKVIANKTPMGAISDIQRQFGKSEEEAYGLVYMAHNQMENRRRKGGSSSDKCDILEGTCCLALIVADMS